VKIGILSDSHNRGDLLRAAIDKLLEEGAQYLLHAGDFCRQEHLQLLSDAGVPYAAVFGNNDGALLSCATLYRIRKEPWYFAIGHLRIKLMHHPFYLSPDADLIISGHTHRFSAQSNERTLYLNPGEICAREQPLSECVLLSPTSSEWKIRHLLYSPSEHFWTSETLLLPRRHLQDNS